MTWSIVATEPTTGAVGAAVASRLFAVGAIVPWIRSGVGAACTQALINPYLGARALDLLHAGVPVTTAVEALAGAEVNRVHRQLHAIAIDGTTAAFTGDECVPWAGHRTLDGASAAGNMLAGPQVVDETLAAFAASAGRPLAERLLRALAAGERAGGDKRGKQSAAVVVHGREGYADVNLRVDDHPDPIAELWRLYEVGHQRYFAFHSAMPTRADPHGVSDRDELERRIEAWLSERGVVRFPEFWTRDPWRDEG